MELTTPKLTNYIPTIPTAKQAAFLLLGCRDAFYGGAAGGGKSEALLMAALQYVDVPGYAAIIFRRTFTDLSLPQAIMSRSREWLLKTDAHWNNNTKTWTFPSGATLSFAYLNGPNDHYRYQGAEFQYVGFDELTQFYENQYLYLFSRLRRKEGMAVPLRIRSASNPGGMGHQWVKNRYLIEGPKKGRVFISAKLADNPHVDQEQYALSLSELDYLTRLQLLEGDWDASYDGGLFKREWFKYLDTPPLITKKTRIARHWDLAATEPSPENPDPDYTVGVKAMRTEDDKIVVLDVVRDRITPGKVKKLVMATAEMDGKGVEISVEQEPGSSGKMVIDEYVRALMGYNVHGWPSSGSKTERAKPLSAQTEHGNVQIVRGAWNSEFINELVWFPQAGNHDDQVDGFTGAFERLVGKKKTSARRASAGSLYNRGNGQDKTRGRK